LIFRLVRNGYNDATVCDMNRTLPVRLLVVLTKPFGCLLPFANRSAMFFFFPFLHVGGAERVHADIVGCFPEEKPWVFFTKKSENDRFRSLFPAGAKLFNIWPLLKYGYPVSVGIMAGFINRHENPVVFGSNSLFYYLLIPFLKPNVRKIDLLHAFGGASDEFSLPAADRLDRRVVITGKTVLDLKAQYQAAGVDSALLDRVTVIENRVQVPDRCPEKSSSGPLRMLFVGRGAPEKRVHLVGRAATRCREQGIPTVFTLVGDVENAVAAADRHNCLFRGEIAGPDELAGIYAEADVLVLTSAREGFPLVIMEAMAHGAVPVCTEVGGIPTHIRDGVNGMLLGNGEEDDLVARLVAAIKLLSDDRMLRENLSQAAFDYARTTFASGGFCDRYRKLLLDGR
jgi:glycosyltransferase involved in cell wall biosynthesis